MELVFRVSFEMGEVTGKTFILKEDETVDVSLIFFQNCWVGSSVVRSDNQVISHKKEQDVG